MSIQPGIGYDVVSTPQGDSLVINFPDAPPGAGPEQFKVIMQGDKVQVAKGRVIAMQSVVSSPFYTSQQALTEFNVQGFAIFPTGSRQEGTDIPNSIWASDGYVTIQKLTQGETPTGSNTWGVYLVRNQVSTSGGDGTFPLLAVIADGSDAYTKSTAFPTDTEGHYNWKCYQQTLGVTISGQGGGNLLVSMLNYVLGNYAAERLKIASIVWADNRWNVTQLLIGTLTIPGSIGGGAIQWVDALPSYPSTTLPSYKSKCEDWFNPWTGYTKLLTSGSGYTTNIVAS